MNEEMKMTQEREGRILEAAIDTWGSEMQIIVAIEEMSELTKALTKYIRGDDAATISINIREEMADVGIMLNQLSLIFGDTAEEEIRKLNRLRWRIEDMTGETLFCHGYSRAAIGAAGAGRKSPLPLLRRGVRDAVPGVIRGRRWLRKVRGRPGRLGAPGFGGLNTGLPPETSEAFPVGRGRTTE